MPDCLLEKRPDGVALITLNRPEKLNSLAHELYTLFAEHIADCEGDPGVRCIAVTGAGRAFCAGGDVDNMKARNEGRMDSPSTDPTVNMLYQVQILKECHDGIPLKLHTVPKPTVALVNGVAVGAGLSIALSCDIRVASSKARFGTAFGRVGLSGDYGGSYFLQRLVGPARARELYFLAEMFDADAALAMGVVNRVVPEERHLEEGLALCTRLAAGPTGAYGRMKANLNLAETATLPQVLDQEAMNMRLSQFLPDGREAVLAFLEKREPRFSGQ